MSPAPTSMPVGLHLVRTARIVSQAFDRAMAEAGGSAAMWQVLVLTRARQWDRQSEMAEAMGVTGATLTHHLNALERRGLVRRWREDGNRRSQRVELTDDGIALFDRMRGIAMAHDRRLRSQLSAGEAAALGELLDKLEAGLADSRRRAPASASA